MSLNVSRKTSSFHGTAIFDCLKTSFSCILKNDDFVYVFRRHSDEIVYALRRNRVGVLL
jgi:hypothetical protein